MTGIKEKIKFAVSAFSGDLPQKFSIGTESIHPVGVAGGEFRFRSSPVDQERQFSPVFQNFHLLISEMGVGIGEIRQMNHQYIGAFRQRFPIQRHRCGGLEAGRSFNPEYSRLKIAAGQSDRFTSGRGHGKGFAFRVQPKLFRIADGDFMPDQPFP